MSLGYAKHSHADTRAFWKRVQREKSTRMSALATKLSKFRALRLAASAERQYKESLAAMSPRQAHLAVLRKLIREAKNWPRQPDRSIRREKPSGWLLPALLDIDDALWGRWDYWCRTRMAGKLLDEPIPQIHFRSEMQNPCRKMLENSLNHVTSHGAWQTWGSSTYMDYFLDWILYGFGDLKELPREPDEGAFSRLYQTFCLEAMLAWPDDYFGFLLAEAKFGRGAGFYPTPMEVTEMMVQMLYHDSKDMRVEKVNDPCVGTGRMLLSSSNFSLCLSGIDIMETCVKATKVNLFLYAPWGARPFPFL